MDEQDGVSQSKLLATTVEPVDVAETEQPENIPTDANPQVGAGTWNDKALDPSAVPKPELLALVIGQLTDQLRVDLEEASERANVGETEPLGPAVDLGPHDALLNEISAVFEAQTTQGSTVEAAVIYNAAMIPGWPFADALVKDAPKVGTQRQVEVFMTVEEMADYLARMQERLAKLRRLKRRVVQTIEVSTEPLLPILALVLQSIIDGLKISLALGQDQLSLLPERAGDAGEKRRFVL